MSKLLAICGLVLALSISDLAAEEINGPHDPDITQLTESADAAIRSGRPDLAWQYKVKVARLLAERGDGTSLQQSVVIYKGALGLVDRERLPQEWAATQAHLGNALQSLGRAYKRTQEVEEAIVAYKAALGEYSIEKWPEHWVSVHDNLGEALSYLATRGKTERYDEAIAAWRAVLTVKTKEKARLEWAMMQFKIGFTYFLKGEYHETGVESFQAALPPLNAASEVYSQDANSSEWGMTQGFIADIHWGIGKRRGDKRMLEAAVVYYEKAIEGFGRSGDAGMLKHAREKMAEVRKAITTK